MGLHSGINTGDGTRIDSGVGLTTSNCDGLRLFRFLEMAPFRMLHCLKAGGIHAVFGQVLQDAEAIQFLEHIVPDAADRDVEMLLTHPQDYFIQSHRCRGIDKRHGSKIDDQVFFGF